MRNFVSFSGQMTFDDLEALINDLNTDFRGRRHPAAGLHYMRPEKPEE